MRASQRPPPQQHDRRYWIGMGIGMIPVVLAWIAIGLSSSAAAGPFAVVAAIGYACLILAAIVCTIRLQWRPVGYGLLTMVFVGPVVWSIGCIAILSHHG